jgi:signal transduction histidine kinase
VKVKVLLITVALYLIGAFSWWTYSLINLSNLSFEIKINNLETAAILAESKLHDLLIKANVPNGVPVYYQEKTYYTDTQLLSELIQLKLDHKFNTHYPTLLSGQLDVQIKPSKSEIILLQQELTSRKRAYYSEAVFFMFLLVVGFGWVYNSLEKILNLNRLQKNFMMSVTHELNTPIAAVKLITQTLKKRKLEPEQQQDLIEKVEQNSDRLQKLIEGLLMAVKLERKTLETSFTEIKLKPLLLDLVNDILTSPSFTGKITLNVDPELKIWGDAMSLKIAFSNIIDNAIKYTGQHLILTIYNENKTIFFADNGPGIPKQEQRKIFRQFYRIGDENTRNTKGTGIGLYLVHNIIKMHKAKITVANNYPHGSIFKLIFK